MVCPKYGGTMKIIAFIMDYAIVDRIIDHLKLTFAAAKPHRPKSSSRSRSRRPRRAGNIFEHFVIRGERKSITYRSVRWGFSSKEPLSGRPEDFLTSPHGRWQYPIMIRRGYLLHEAAIHRAAEKANSYSFLWQQDFKQEAKKTG
jgi:hypothetical protein